MPLTKEEKDKLKKVIRKYKLPAPKKAGKPKKISVKEAPGGPRPKTKEEYKKVIASRK